MSRIFIGMKVELVDINKNKITQEDVDSFIVEVQSQQLGDKTTVVVATLANGFILTESSSCVDPNNFNMDIGTSICMEHIKDRVWFLLGFLLQCGQSSKECYAVL